MDDMAFIANMKQDADPDAGCAKSTARSHTTTSAPTATRYMSKPKKIPHLSLLPGMKHQVT